MFQIRFFFLFYISIQLIYCSNQCRADYEPLICSNPSMEEDDFKMASLLYVDEKFGLPMKNKPLQLIKEWSSPRIGYFSGDTYKNDRRCPKDAKNSAKTITTVKNEKVNCQTRSGVGAGNDVEINDKYKEILRESARLVTVELKEKIIVNPLKTTKVKFDESTDHICKHFNMNYGSGLKGIFTFDMIVFFSAHQMSAKDKNEYAYAQFCPSNTEDPLILIVNRNPDKMKENMYEHVTNTVRKVFGLDLCSGNRMIVERSNKGIDVTLNKCLKYNCNAKHGQKFVEYQTKRNADWMRCTDRNGIPLINRNRETMCPSWDQLCSATMNDKITHNITKKGKHTVGLKHIPALPSLHSFGPLRKTDKSNMGNKDHTIDIKDEIHSTETILNEKTNIENRKRNSSFPLPINSSDGKSKNNDGQSPQKDKSYESVYFYCNSVIIWVVIVMIMC